MLNINESRLMGRLVDDPTFGTTANGQEFMRLRVITSKNYKNDSGEWQERVTGHSVITFDRYRIQHGRDRLRKGTMVYVEGENAENKRVENGQTTYYRGVFVPMGGKLHSMESGRTGDSGNGDNEGAERAGRKAQGGSAKGKSEDKSAKTSGKVPDGPPIDGKNPLDHHDHYDDEMPF